MAPPNLPSWKSWAVVVTGLYPTLVVMQSAVLPTAYKYAPPLERQPSSIKLFVTVSATVAIMVSAAAPLSSRLLSALKFNPAAIASLHAAMVGATGLAAGDFTAADVRGQLDDLRIMIKRRSDSGDT